MIKRIQVIGVILVMVWSVCWVALPAAVEAAPAVQAGVGRVRFVHAALEAATLQAYVDDTLWATIQPRDAVNYQNVPAGAHTFSFRFPDASAPLSSVEIDVQADQRVTIAVLDGSDGPVVHAYTDDVSAPARNAARLTVIHATPDADSITVEVDGTTMAAGLAYGEASAGHQVFDGPHDLALVVGDEAQPLTGAVRTFVGNRTYALYVVGSAAAGEFEVIVVESSVLRPSQNSQFRVANMARGIGDVAVYINNEDVPIFPQVRFSRVTQYYTTGLGMHRVEIYPVGAGRDGPPLARATAEIGPDEHVLFVIQGTAAEMSVEAYSSDLKPVGVGYARLQVINAAAGNGAFLTETMDGYPLFDALAVGETDSRVVPDGTIGIRFTDDTTGEMMMEQAGIQVQRGTVTIVLAFDNDPDVSLVNAVTVRVEGAPQYAMLRWAHLASQQGPVDVYLDDEPVVLGMVYGMVIDYKLFLPVSYTLRLYPARSNPATADPLVEERVYLSRVNDPRTVLVVDSPDGLRVTMTRDSLEWLPPDTSRIRFINAALGASNVYVRRTNGMTWIDNLGPGSASIYANVDPTTVTFSWVLVGRGVIADVADLAIESGTVYTVVLVGDVAMPDTLGTLVWTYTP